MTDWAAILAKAAREEELDPWGLPPRLRVYAPGDLGGSIDPPSKEVLIGPIGEWLTRIGPETETSLAALGGGLLAALGAWFDRSSIVRLGRLRHRANLFVVVVGPSSYARKGTAAREVRGFMHDLDSVFVGDCFVAGFGSGEALVERVSDPVFDRDGKLLRGAEDQRLVINEAEFAKVLRISNRDGSTMSDVLREAYDGTAPLENRTKRGRYVSSDHHISLYAGITPEELSTQFTEADATGGFGNRILWVWSNERKLLPFGGARVNVDSIIRRLHASRTSRRAVMELSGEAQAWWSDHYSALRLVADFPAQLRSVVSRSPDHVLRIAAIYAATVGSDIEIEHLEAGLAWVRHSHATVRNVLGTMVESRLAGRILESVRNHPGTPASRSELWKALGRNHTKAEMDKAIAGLERDGLVFRFTMRSTGGRPAEVLIATTPVRL